MINIEAAVTGDAEVKAAFRQVFDLVRDKLKTRMISLSERLRDRARANAPRKSGKLANSINARVHQNANNIVATVGRPRFYGYFQEKGLHAQRHAPRTRGIVGVRTKMIGGVARVSPRRGLVPRRSLATHAFVLPAHPFMGPAMDSMRGEIESDLRSVLSEV